MRTKTSKFVRSNKGFSLMELMVATVLFTLITGIVFAALMAAQARYRSEKSLLGSFQQANVAIDQITRDIHASGYPPAIVYNSAFATLANSNRYALPVAWSPIYPNAPCTIGATCASPGSWDLILEADLRDGNGVQWIRYQLDGNTNTLMRGVVRKAVGVDPMAATAGNMFPYLENVMNNAPAAQRAAISAQYPAMFPGGNPVPVFTFPPFNGFPQQLPTIHNINITLVVQAQDRDSRNNQLRVVTLTGQASPIN